MSDYISDRTFTDRVHNQVAIPKIYAPIGWQEDTNRSPFQVQNADMFQGIDYVFKHNGSIATVQERFRGIKYRSYFDFTLRYKRDKNAHTDRRQSEFFKIKADYFTYGVANVSKKNVTQCTDLVKFVVVDLRLLYSKIDSGDIFIVDNGKNYCRIIDNKMECPIKYNLDDSSSFVPFDVPCLFNLWGNSLFVLQKGYIAEVQNYCVPKPEVNDSVATLFDF